MRNCPDGDCRSIPGGVRWRRWQAGWVCPLIPTASPGSGLDYANLGQWTDEEERNGRGAHLPGSETIRTLSPSDIRDGSYTFHGSPPGGTRAQVIPAARSQPM